MLAEDRYDGLIRYYAELHGRIPAQVKRQIRCESNFNRNAMSSAGAVGLLQFMASTWADLGSPLVARTDPEESIGRGCRYMAKLEERYHDLSLALAAYNWGIGHVDTIRTAPDWRTHLPQETQQYVTRCLDWSAESIG